MQKHYLRGAYKLKSAEDTKDLYSQWAQSYDQEITENGYASPQRTANALVKCGAKLEAPILDIGCGSGVSGLFLKDAGFTELHGSDFSQEMLALAEQKNLYSQLHLADLRFPFDFVRTSFGTVSAVGVMAPGHAQPELIETVISLLEMGGLFGFSLNDHSLEDPGYMAEINRLIFDHKVRVRWQEYGEHLPKIELNSLIIVLQRIQ